MKDATLILKRGESAPCIKLDNGLYIKKKEEKDYLNNERVSFFAEYKGAGILVSYSPREFLANQLMYNDVNESVGKYVQNAKDTVLGDSLNGAAEFFSSASNYLNALCGADLEQIAKFKERWESELERKELARLQKRLEDEQQEKLDRIERNNRIKDDIINEEYVSGRDVLDLMNALKYECPIKTKGLINRFDNIMLTQQPSASIKHGKKPAQASIDNVFRVLANFKNYLKENDEYEKMTAADKAEVERLFKK